MKLVELLAAGVNGCESGTATFVLRGTASSAASVLYNDAEGTSQPGTNIITLDAHGAAEVYCNAYVDITLKTSAGSTVRTVTVMNSATTSEVISDSFTGTGYTGSPTAASQPITLAAVLDKWNNSAGTLDWKVLVNGVATNLQSAIAAFAGLFYNVKDPTFGALGDGSTDDTNAIAAAITAASVAGGGIVFFPPSTSNYKFTTLTVSAANITLMGSGPKASKLQSASTSAALITFTDHTAGAWKRIAGLSINGTGANANEVLAFQQTQQVVLDNVVIDCASYTGSVVTRSATAGATTIDMRDCHITLGSGNAIGLSNLAGDAQTHWNVINSRFTVPASFVGSVVKGPNFDIRGTLFDASAVTSGAYYHINSVSNNTASKFLGTFSNNKFIDGGSSGFAFNLTDAVTGTFFRENGNIFEGFTAPSSSANGHIFDGIAADIDTNIFKGSRIGNHISLTNSSTSLIAIHGAEMADSILITHTGAGVFQATAPTLKPGEFLQVTVLNNDGSSRNITIGGVTVSSVASGSVARFVLTSGYSTSGLNLGYVIDSQ